MWGGPSHIDLFDMKPRAPSELRGPFREVSTNVLGFGKLLHPIQPTGPTAKQVQG